MDKKTFFSYYIPALEAAFSRIDSAKNEEGWEIRHPNWFYPAEIWDILDEYEDLHYEIFPVLGKVSEYFEAIIYEYPSIFGVELDSYKEQICKEIETIKKELGFSTKDG